MTVNLRSSARGFYLSTEKFKRDSHDVLDEVITPGTHRVLRFDFLSVNVGRSDLAIGSPEDYPDWFVWSAGHDHYHLKDFNNYTLYNKNGQVVGQSYKQSFCLLDSVPRKPWASDRQFYDCNSDQGISAGWADKYTSDLPGQYVVVDGVQDGRYTLEATTDYSNYFSESNESDNTVLVGLKIRNGEVFVIDPPFEPDPNRASPTVRKSHETTAAHDTDATQRGDKSDDGSLDQSSCGCDRFDRTRVDGDDAAGRDASASNDWFRGRDGDHWFQGEDGDDRLRGGDGKDHLKGDAGDDRLNGGDDADTFVFTKDGGFDRVVDFNVHEGDKLAFKQLGIDDEADVSALLDGTSALAQAEQKGEHVLITFETGEKALLKEVELTSLSKHNFLYL